MPLRGMNNNINAFGALAQSPGQASPASFTQSFNREIDSIQADQRFDMGNQIRGMTQMVKDPANAKLYADAYKISYTPELQELLKDPRRSQQMIESVEMAKSMGVDTYDGYKAFAGAYMQSDGDPFAAASALDNYVSNKDMRMPAGYMRTGSGQASRIPGIDDSYYQNQGRYRTPITITPNLVTGLEGMIDGLTGVVPDPANPKTNLAEGSLPPLDPMSKKAVTARATEIYQQTRNPYTAIQQAIDELGVNNAAPGEMESPFQEENPDEKWYIPFDGKRKVKYRSIAPSASTGGSAAGVPEVDTSQPVDQALPNDLPATATVMPNKLPTRFNPQRATPENIKTTAQKYGMSEEEVMKRLGMQ